MGSRADLQATIERQKEQLLKYQTKLRDVVSAYKGLQSEKAALEASVTALSTGASETKPRSKEPKTKPTPSPRANDSDQPETEDEEENRKKEEEAEEQREQEENEQEEEVARLREQLRTLTASLATVSQEKSKMQASFQADKKKIRQEQEDQITALENAAEQKMQQMKEMQDQLQEYKQRVRSAQHEREKEQDDHALMLRELQKLLAKERSQRETMEQQLEDTKQALQDKQPPTDLIEEYERRISQLQSEQRATQNKIRNMEAQAREPSAQLLLLQKEMAEIKAQHRIQLQHEQRRAAMAEDGSKVQGKENEDRISTLESKITELSNVVGTYEKQRCQDQATIAKMRERVTQLDMENTALAKAAHTIGSDSEDVDDVAGPQDIQSIVDKISRLKAALKLANEKEDKPIDIEVLLREGHMEADVHRSCVEELNQLREEFERYKLRAQSVLKNKATPKETQNPELENLKSQVGELKERLRFLRQDYDEQESSHKKKEETLRKTMEALQERHKQDMNLQESQFKNKVTDLEGEVRKHRNRTISLLAEKDREIEMLRESSPEKLETAPYLGSASFNRSLNRSPSLSSDPPGAAASSEQDAVFAELFARTSFTGTGSTLGETTALLHFAEEQARKDVEIAQYRRHKHSLEQRLRELQQASMVAEEANGAKIELLQEEIRKLERNKNRESANLEYLKNVVYHYMVCQDVLGKQQMLRAIATILQFSPRETDQVADIIVGGRWWGGGGGERKPAT